MNWAAFGGSEFFIPEGIHIDSRCPLSRNITECERKLPIL
ncbi:RFX4 isoform 8 [Pongo abelii]|uniref:RFX4 isoform 8 n=1 Tax=Pongo abelii TaxID=9601 RepID=A0A2J8XLX5_PONAB|nr:RFX4 isoform 8 [Pongo abelii]